MKSSKIKILIFDDNPKMLNSLLALIEAQNDMEICGAFRNAINIVEMVRGHLPDVVILDVDMPGVDGIEGLSRLKKHFENIPVLMLTAFDDREKIFAALRNGAQGYILKSTAPDQLLKSIREAHQGGVPFSNAVAHKVLEHFQKPSNATSMYNLSTREIEVLRLLVEGVSFQQVADQLHISYETVRTHIKHIYAKLNVATLTEAVVKAVREQLVD